MKSSFISQEQINHLR